MIDQNPTQARNQAYDFPIFVRSVLDDSGLSPAAFRILGHLARRAGKDNDAWPSYASMGEILRPGWPKAKAATLRRLAMKAVEELVETGWVAKEQTLKDDGSYGSNHYRLISLHERQGAETLERGGDEVVNREAGSLPESGILHREDRASTRGGTRRGGGAFTPRGGNAPGSVIPPRGVFPPKGTPIKVAPIKVAPIEGTPPNHVRAERSVISEKLVGWVVAPPISESSFASTAPEPKMGKARPTYRAEAESPPGSENPPPDLTPEQAKSFALLIDGEVGFDEQEARKLVTTYSSEVIEGVVYSVARDKTAVNPPGLILHRLRKKKFGQVTAADRESDLFRRHHLEYQRSRYQVDPEYAPAPVVEPDFSSASQEVSSAPVSDEDQLVADWPDILKTGLGNIVPMQGSYLVKTNDLADGTPVYWLQICDPGSVEWVEIQALEQVKRSITIWLGGRPFLLEGVGAGLAQ